MEPGLEIRLICNELLDVLTEFFIEIQQSEEYKFFHPHPFDSQTAKAITDYSGHDLYYALMQGSRMCGYGMLRGWDAGFEIPSLGIIIHPSKRRKQLGSLLLNFLHITARIRGAKKIRLKVYHENSAALELYNKFGYIFGEKDTDGQLIGILNL